MVLFHGVHQPIENIRDGMGDAAPIRDHGDAQRVSKKAIGRHLHASKKHLYGAPLFMAVKEQTVDCRVIFVPTDGFLRRLEIRGPQGLQHAFREDQPFARQSCGTVIS